MGKGRYDLSEMYIVRNLYPVKAEKYIRYHGLTNFGQGGQANDVLIAWERFGYSSGGSISRQNIV